jgi:hypothetical protein
MQVIQRVRAAQPDLLFLAIPSQRKGSGWPSTLLHSVSPPMGVGGSFDVLAGRSSAPKVGSAHRMRVGVPARPEPRRMWKRYLVGNTVHVAHDQRTLEISMKRIAVIAGARPNFMKVKACLRLQGRASRRFWYTGQHYDASMGQLLRCSAFRSRHPLRRGQWNMPCRPLA